MTCVMMYTVVINGRQTRCNTSLSDASHKASKLRNIHGKFNVWVRPAHYELVVA